MFRNHKRIADHETRLATLALAVAELRHRADHSTDEAILKLIEAMQVDIDTIRISLRSLHGKVAYDKRGKSDPQARDTPDDEEFQRLIELQRSN